MSYQSDILCLEDQSYLLDQIDTKLFQEITEEPTLLMNDLEEYKQLHVKEAPTTGVLSNEEYIGPYEFEVYVLPRGSKNAWVYSEALNKVYMDMKIPFPVDFKVKNRPDFPLFIRITPMYSSPQYAQDCVYRCLNHEFTGNSNELFHIRQHVIRCNNPQTQYVGDKLIKERLSLLIPFSFPQKGTYTVREMFEFMCKNSCPPPGMNRRSIEVIFTLENQIGDILGRKALNVRICSCPKRDKEKDENDNAGKPPQGKKRKVTEKCGKRASTVSHQDLKETLLTIPVVGKHNYNHILKYCQDLYSGEIIRHGNTAEAVPYKEALSKINAIIRECTD